MPNAQHSSLSEDHWTPAAVTDRARRVMSGIELDPCSTDVANRTGAQADRIFTTSDNGLTQPWRAASVFVNPPGGTLAFPGLGRRSQAAVWWVKAATEWWEGRVDQVIFLGFTVEILQTTQALAEAGVACPVPMTDAALCFPSHRIRFDRPAGGGREASDSPTHANVIAYLGRGDHLFVSQFESLGGVVVGRRFSGLDTARKLAQQRVA